MLKEAEGGQMLCHRLILGVAERAEEDIKERLGRLSLDKNSRRHSLFRCT